MESHSHFYNRNLLHLLVVCPGHPDVILPVYLHVQTKHLSWINEDPVKIINEIQTIIIESMESIYKLANNASTEERPRRLVGNNMIIAFDISKRIHEGYVLFTEYDCHKGTDKIVSPSQASFSLNPTWIFPYNNSEPNQYLPIDY